MKVTLNRLQIDLAISLGTASLARYVKAYGIYNNTFNSHIKGRFGEIAVASLFKSRGREVESNFLDPLKDRCCDVVVAPAAFNRLEVKTWREDGWAELGRCISPKQVSKLSKEADAIVWCTVPIRHVEDASALEIYETLEVSLVGYSLIDDVKAAPKLYTGEGLRRPVYNHQIDPNLIRQIEEILR